MKKLLIIALLIVGCMFGDTIVYKSGRNNRTIENVEFTKAGNGKVYFKAHGGEVSRDCSKVVTFTDNIGNPIVYDCNAVIVEESLKELKKKIDDTLTGKDVESIIQNTKRPLLGGIFIAIGGGILISQNEKDYEDIGDLDEFQTTTTIAYALITIGGVLITFGI